MSANCTEKKRGRKKNGFIMVLGVLMIVSLLLPAAGLAVDVGMMYLVQSLLSAAADASTLAGARALSRGSISGKSYLPNSSMEWWPE